MRRAGTTMRARCVAAVLGAAATVAPARADDPDPSLRTLRDGTVASAVDGRVQEGPVRLPYHWERVQGGRPGSARFTLPLVLARAPTEPWGLFIPRVGTAFDVSVNGALLQSYGDLAQGHGADYAKAPIYLPVPARLLQAGDNTLQIRIRADAGRRAGLAPVTVGPAAVVRDRLFAPAYAWRFTGSVLLAAFSLVVGAVALGLWLARAESAGPDGEAREPLYLWAALAEFCWALRVADGAIAEPPLPWIAWGMLMAACYGGWAGSCIMFCQHLAGWQARRGLRWLPRAVAAVFSVPVLVTWLSLTRGAPGWLTAWLAVEIAAVTAYAACFIGATLRRPTPARALLAAVLAITLAVAARDWFAIRVSGDYGGTTYVRYTSVLFGLTLLGIVTMRFRQASARSREVLRTLAVRVADRENELAAAYRRLEVGARAQERAQERERILRDMHDSVGSHLSTAIRQLQSDRVRPAEVLGTLRDSMDHLKLSIDALQLPAGDVQALLSGLRYRFEPRLAGAGLALEWAVEELRPLDRLDAAAMRHLQFLLFEALSNVLQHARARLLRIEAARADDGGLRIHVIDDGVGFDASRMPRSLARRAGAIGARLDIRSRPGCTVVEIALDPDRADDVAAPA